VPLRYQALKQLLLKADAFFWDGTRYQTKAVPNGKLDPAFDLNAGAEFSILPAVQRMGAVQQRL
jgi:hypothetical protein